MIVQIKIRCNNRSAEETPAPVLPFVARYGMFRILNYITTCISCLMLYHILQMPAKVKPGFLNGEFNYRFQHQLVTDVTHYPQKL